MSDASETRAQTRKMYNAMWRNVIDMQEYYYELTSIQFSRIKLMNIIYFRDIQKLVSNTPHKVQIYT